MPTRSLKTFLIFLIIPFVLSCARVTSVFSSAPTQEEIDKEEIDKEEQAVYSFFIGGGKGPALILQNTSTGISADDPQETVDYIKSGLPALSRETLNNFMERNKEAGPLSADMDLGVEYILLTPEELSEITSQPNWHEVMAEKYSGSVGYTAFSRVGFNKTLDQAVIYVGEMAGPLMGAGFYYMLEKELGEWKIKEQIMVWIS